MCVHACVRVYILSCVHVFMYLLEALPLHFIAIIYIIICDNMFNEVVVLGKISEVYQFKKGVQKTISINPIVTRTN